VTSKNVHPHITAAKLVKDLIKRAQKKPSQVAREMGIPRVVLYELCQCKRLFKAELIEPMTKALNLSPETISQLHALADECARSDKTPIEVSATPEMLELGKLLREERKSMRKTLQIFAAELDMHAPNYGGYERGTRRMSMATAGRIIRALKMSDEKAKHFLRLVAATNPKKGRLAPVSTSREIVGMLEFELSRKGVVVQAGDLVKTELTPQTFAKLKAILPQLQQLLADKMVKIGLAQGAGEPPSLDQTPFSAVVEHADGRATFVMIDVMNAAPNPVEPVSTN